MTKALAADELARFLERQGVRTVFEVVGGMTAHLVDAIHRHGKTRILSTRHEQAAAFAADASARMTGVPGVALATSGPGATNLLTGIGSCYFDSVPAVFITGQVNSYELRGKRPIRQLGFQETDIVTMARPITKAAIQVSDASMLEATMEQAFACATEGRAGPVLVDITMDAQRSLVEPWKGRPARPQQRPIPDVAPALDALSQAERPLILAGGGVRAAGVAHVLADFADRHNVPVVHSLMAVDVLPAGHRCRLGMIGSYGNRWANLAVAASDYLLVVGSRLDIRQTGSRADAFKGDRRIFHVDVDAGEINNRVAGCDAIVAHLADFFSAATTYAGTSPARTKWFQEIEHLRSTWPDTAELAGAAGINPNWLMHRVAAASAAAGAFVVDVGQHQMWAAQSLAPRAHQRFFTSGGIGAMGYALPAAIGAAAASNAPVMAIIGDGAAQVNIQELQTISQHKLPIKILILNNQCHGMVRQFQKSYFDARYVGTMWGYSAPEFASVARAFGLEAESIGDAAQLDAALARLWTTDSPRLLEVAIDPLTDVYPKLAFGRTIADMEPQSKPVDMEPT